MYYNSLITRLRRHKFRRQPYLSNQAVFSTCPKSHDKNINILRTKRAFTMEQKAFFIIFEGLSLKQIKKISEGESPTLTIILVGGRDNFTFSHYWFFLSNSETVKAVTLLFCSIQQHFIRNIPAKFGISNLPQSPDFWGTSISGFPLKEPLRSPPRLGLMTSILLKSLIYV